MVNMCFLRRFKSIAEDTNVPKIKNEGSDYIADITVDEINNSLKDMRTIRRPEMMLLALNNTSNTAVQTI